MNPAKERWAQSLRLLPVETSDESGSFKTKMMLYGTPEHINLSYEVTMTEGRVERILICTNATRRSLHNPEFRQRLRSAFEIQFRDGLENVSFDFSKRQIRRGEKQNQWIDCLRMPKLQEIEEGGPLLTLEVHPMTPTETADILANVISN